ncbi:MAG: hypothetical protein PHF38_08790 [Bacteroidales bacterium]|nr:hypothetical protein [Bacteroidales bacterium]MDD4362527.1 hypothetical protein [Bacteroidales bacterium]MDD4431442.1 hypothetical protein [Bacteroidales bacterium]
MTRQLTPGMIVAEMVIFDKRTGAISCILFKGSMYMALTQHLISETIGKEIIIYTSGMIR